MKFTGNVARASRWQFVKVNENSLFGIARIEGQHALVDVLLQAFAAIARSQSAARGAGEQANLDTLGLRVSRPGDILNDGTPFTVNVQSAQRAGVMDIAGANVSFLADPVGHLESLARVVGVVVMFLR